MRTFAPGFGGIPGRFWCGSGWVQTQKKPYFVGLFCLFALITCSGAAGKTWTRRRQRHKITLNFCKM